MSALVLAAAGRVEVQHRDLAAVGPTDVVIDIVATGICGSDVHGAAGDTGRRTIGQVMGHETVGRIASAGPEVEAGWVGRLVAIDPVVACGTCAYCEAAAPQHCVEGWVLGVRSDRDGAYAEQMVVPWRSVVALAEDITPWHGALVEPLAVGYHASVRGEARASDRVLILGGGPIGQAVAIGCRRRGVSTILVSEPDDTRGALIEQMGFQRCRPDDLETATAEHLDESATLVFDVVGTDRTLASALAASAPLGRIVLVGMDSPLVTLGAYAVSAGERTLLGTICSTRRDFGETADWVASNPDTIELMVDAHEPLASGPEVFTELMAGTRRVNKVLLHPAGVPERRTT